MFLRPQATLVRSACEPIKVANRGCMLPFGSGGPMTTRRGLFLGALVVFSAALGVAHAGKRAPFEVTYYYMPG